MKEMTLQQVRKLIERLKERRAPHSDVCAVQVKDLDALESALLEQQASAVPDKWAMVPATFQIDAGAWAAAQFAFGGPGTGEGEEFMDCTAWVGEVTEDDGSKTNGLHISCNECPEEGSITLAKFAAPQPPKANRCPARVIHPKPAPPGPCNPPIWCCLPEGHDEPHRHNGGGMYPSIPFRKTDKVSMEPVTSPPPKVQP